MLNKTQLKNMNNFIIKGKLKFNNKFDYSQVHSTYENMNSIITIICPIHGAFEIKAYRHTESNYGCQKCGIAARAENSKSTTSDFVQKARLRHGDKYDYSKSNYINAITKLIIICPEHGDFEQTPNGHLCGQGCYKCGQVLQGVNNPNKINFDSYVSKCNEKFNNKFTYNENSFINMTSYVEITCPEHGTFEMGAFDHLNSETGCRKCGRLLNDQRRTKTTEYFVQKARLKHGDKYDYSKSNYINDQTLVTITCQIHGDFEQTPNNHTYSTGCPQCAKINTVSEYELLDLIPDSIQNDRKFIKPYEIDILSHEYKFGIEYNGLLWHSFGTSYPNNIEEYSQKKYQHLNKTKLVEEKEYQLFHIFENEWLNSTQKEIWKSMLNNKIGKSNRIFARKCKIIELNNDEYREFIKSNHIQGYRGAVHKYGLLYENELVACMSFSKPTKGKYDYELIRFCNKLNHNVIGGASKLLKYFESNIDAKVIVSYANRRWSQGNLYEKLGFEFIENSDPNYYYLDNNCKMHSRRNFQKHMLKDRLSDFDESLTEFENMMNHNFRIIHDSGNKVYVKNKNERI